MAFRQRTPTFRPQLSVRRVYETMQPRSELKETPEAFLLHVYIPGFTKDRIKITLEDFSKIVRIAGERPLQGNRWIRFDQTYPIPENSEADTLEANFEQSTLILKIQKKLIPQLAPKQEEVEPKSPKHPSDDKPLEEEPKVEKVLETIPPQPKNPKIEEENEDKKSAHKEETLSQIAQETITNDHNPQKDKEEFETKPTSLETTKAQIDENLQKGHEGVEPKPRVTTNTKEQLKENLVEKSVEEDIEKEKILKKEIKEEHEKIEKGKEAEEPLVPKVEEKEKEKESCFKTSLNKEGKSSGKGIVEGNGMRKLAVPSSNFVTRMAAGKWSYEERYLLENIGAAVLVIAAFGAYVSYRFAS